MVEVTQRYPPAIGGVETHVSKLSREMLKLGVDITVLTTDLARTNPIRRMDVPLGKSYYQDGVRVLRTRAFEALPLTQGLGVFSPEMLFHLKGADVIHSHGYGRFPTFFAPLSRFLGIPVVITTHSDLGGRSIGKRAFDAAIPWVTVRRAKLVIALSSHERFVLRRLGVRQENLRVIPNGVDIEEFAHDRDRRNGNLVKQVLFVGRVDFPQKGVDLLLLAFAELVGFFGKAVKLRIVGPDWGGLERSKSMASELGIQDQVDFLGECSRPDLVSYMQSSDVLAVPSRFEPFGIVILESMAAGLPVVASRVGAIPEIIQDGHNGLLFEAGNPESLAEKLAFILNDDDYARNLAVTASSEVRKYGWDEVARLTLENIREACNRA